MIKTRHSSFPFFDYIRVDFILERADNFVGLSVCITIDKIFKLVIFVFLLFFIKVTVIWTGLFDFWINNIYSFFWLLFFIYFKYFFSLIGIISCCLLGSDRISIVLLLDVATIKALLTCLVYKTKLTGGKKIWLLIVLKCVCQISHKLLRRGQILCFRNLNRE